MPRAADFKDSHIRHWADAEFLYQNSRWANADHLYGFSVECALKAVMLKLGMPLNSQGSPKEKEHRQHVDKLWPTFFSFAKGRAGSWYIRRMPSGTPFTNWKAEDRYANQLDISQAEADAHRTVAREIRNLIRTARLTGRL
jgi:hypothetical protein